MGAARLLREPDLAEARHHDGWDKPPWHPSAAVEHQAVREAVGVFDLVVHEVLGTGADAAATLDELSAGDVAGQRGRSVYTQWRNDAGGIEADLTVRAAATRVPGHRRRDSPAVSRLRLAVAGRHATVTDLTSAYAVLAVMGPNSRALLNPLTTADLSDDAFPFGTNRHIDIGDAAVWANRMSYVGELGWELFVPAEFAVSVFDTLMAFLPEPTRARPGALWLLRAQLVAAREGLSPLGSRHHHRRHPGGGGPPFVAWDKATPFRGCALEAQRGTGATERLVQVKLDQPDDDAARLLHHNEPLLRDGEPVGYVTSGARGHTLGAAIMAIAIRGDRPVDTAWIDDAHWAVSFPAGRCWRRFSCASAPPSVRVLSAVVR